MGLFDAGRRGREPQVTDRWLTLPNGVTALRLLGLPLFGWLVLGREALGVALTVLVVVAATDWLDGYLARRLDQVSRVGAVIDPLVDRLLVFTTVIVLGFAGLLPWVVGGLIVLRDVLVVVGSFALFGAVPPIPVSRTGKAATALLMIGLPLVLLAGWLASDVLRLGALAVTVAGLVVYYVAAVQYVRAVLALRRGEGSDAR